MGRSSDSSSRRHACVLAAQVHGRVGAAQKADATTPCLTDAASRRAPLRRDVVSIHDALRVHASGGASRATFRLWDRSRTQRLASPPSSNVWPPRVSPSADAHRTRRKRGRSSIVRLPFCALASTSMRPACVLAAHVQVRVGTEKKADATTPCLTDAASRRAALCRDVVSVHDALRMHASGDRAGATVRLWHRRRTETFASPPVEQRVAVSRLSFFRRAGTSTREMGTARRRAKCFDARNGDGPRYLDISRCPCFSAFGAVVATTVACWCSRT